MKLHAQAGHGLAGRALAASARLLGWLATAIAAIAAVIVLTIVIIAWRLAVGPVDVTALLQTVETHVHRPVRLSVAHATIAWNGWHDPAAPLVLVLNGVAVNGRDDRAAVSHLNRLSVAIRPASLLRLELLPASISLDGGTLHLVRDENGALELAPGFPLATSHPRRSGGPSFDRDLERVHVAGLRVALHDDRTGLDLDATGIAVDVVRPDPAAPMTGTAHARLASGTASTAADAAIAPATDGSRLTVGLGPLDPSAFTALAPALSAWHAETRLTLAVMLDHRLRPRSAVLTAAASAGRIVGGGSAVPIAGATVHVELRSRSDLDGRVVLNLAGTDGKPGPVVSVAATLTGALLASAPVSGAAEITATAVPIAAVGTWWPAQVARGGRQWVIQNLTAGTASNLDVHLALASRAGLAGLGVASVGGGFDGSGVALHWLRPIPPITEAAAHLQIEDEDSLTITLGAGRQGPLDVTGTRMRISGLSAKDQPADIDAHIRGPLAAVLAVLNEKRLHLLSKQPLTLSNPAGTVDARLHLALPLDDRVTMEQIVIGAHVTLSAVHLGDIALGHSIDDGRFVLDADTDGLSMRGNAAFAGLPVALSVALDFRAGPPSQVTEHVSARTRADADAIRRASTSFGRLLDGDVDLSADYAMRRDKRADLLLDADLAKASIDTPFGWGKQAGPPATLHAALTLQDGQLAAIDRLSATGPGLDIATHSLAGAGVDRLAFDRIVIGRTRAAGRLDFPAATGGAGFRLALAGPELDLASLFGTPAKRPPPGNAPRRPKPAAPAKSAAAHWSATLAFDRVALANHVEIGGVHAAVAGAGAHLGTASATATGPVPLTGSLRPATGGTRRLLIDTSDAGGLLTAFDLTDRIRTGSLSVAATLAGDAPDDGIGGTLRLERFTLLRVPAVVLLLRDLTVYGLADPAKTPDISVTRVTVPFQWRNGVLTIDHARAWQPALGMTAKGTVDTGRGTLDLQGTIVPAYAFNTLPGRLPVVGHLFSPERGGGLFAATFSLRGPSGNPKVSVNPLAALLPGMLRGLLSD